MGRPSMSPEAIRNNKINIINAARKMIREDGVQSVSARSLGGSIGMNSALIYRYFNDIDELILFACVNALREYADEITTSAKPSARSEKDLYILTWEVFSRHAFNNAEEFNILFFSRHSGRLSEVISAYVELFPEEVEDEYDVLVHAMLSSSSLIERNRMVLAPVLKKKYSDERITLINEMTVSYFFALLTQLLDKTADISADDQISRMMEAVHFTLDI